MICSVERCDNAHLARGLCRKHYEATRRSLKNQWHRAHRDIINARTRSRRIVNREQYNAYAREWNQANREKNNAYDRKERFLHPGISTARSGFRRAHRIQATPRWLTKEQKQEMKQFYVDCPKGYHVDHIYPLKSNIVCGLHVPWNLQYLSASENLIKGNKVEVKYYE
jgi:hypothetical protein